MGKEGKFRVALTGANSLLGKKFLAYSRNKKDFEKIVVLDIDPPQVTSKKVKFKKLDLLDPECAKIISRILKEEKCNSILHLASFSLPPNNLSLLHEIEVIGVLKILYAARTSGVKKIVFKSSAMVYGANPDNPSLISEEHPLMSDKVYHIEDKKEAEEIINNFSRKYREFKVTVLRFGFIVGPSREGFFSNYLSLPVVPFPLGLNPLIQILHEDDALNALIFSFYGKSDTYNIAGKEPIPLNSIIKKSGKPSVAIPLPVLKSLWNRMWKAGIASFPGVFFDYLSYPFLLDTTRALKKLKLNPSKTTEEAVVSFREGK